MGLISRVSSRTYRLFIVSFDMSKKKFFRSRPIIFIISCAALTCAIIGFYKFEKLQIENSVRLAIEEERCKKYPVSYAYQIKEKYGCLEDAKIEYETLPAGNVKKIEASIMCSFITLIITTYLIGSFEQETFQYLILLVGNLISSALTIFVTIYLFRKGFETKQIIYFFLSSSVFWINTVLFAFGNLMIDCRNNIYYKSESLL